MALDIGGEEQVYYHTMEGWKNETRHEEDQAARTRAKTWPLCVSVHMGKLGYVVSTIWAGPVLMSPDPLSGRIGLKVGPTWLHRFYTKMGKGIPIVGLTSIYNMGCHKWMSHLLKNVMEWSPLVKYSIETDFVIYAHLEWKRWITEPHHREKSTWDKLV